MQLQGFTAVQTFVRHIASILIPEAGLHIFMCDRLFAAAATAVAVADWFFAGGFCGGFFFASDGFFFVSYGGGFFAPAVADGC